MIDPSMAAAFVAVADTLSFTRAATQLGLSQPQVSLRVRKLEAQVGFALFSRTTRQVAMTYEAARAWRRKRAVVDACRGAEAFIDQLERSRMGALRFGSPEVTMRHPIRGSLLRGFMERYSTTRLEISIGVTTDLVDRLQAGDVDALLLYRFVDREGRAPPAWQDVIAIERAVGSLIVPQDHALARLGVIASHDIAGQEIVLSPGTQCPDVIDEIVAQLRRLGARHRSAPESHRTTLQYFALNNRLPYFDWTAEGLPPPPPPGGAVLRAFDDGQFMHELCLVTRRADQQGPIRGLRRLAQEISGLEPLARSA
jgi:DNA-binding transcriptional LysR family regulator